MGELWSRIANRAGRQIDRLMHSRARRQARRRTNARACPARVVVVCYGNICRSPYAAAVLRRRLASTGFDGMRVDSAGLFGADRPANRQATEEARQRGIPLGGHRSRLFRRSDAEGDSLILVMTRSQRRQLIREFAVDDGRIELLGDFDAEDPPYREILDPYGKSDEEFRRVFSQIDRSVNGLLDIWSAQGGPQGGPAAGSGA